MAAATSQLAKLQSALAALLMEPGRLDAFRADPAAYGESFGLAGKDLALFAGLPHQGAAYFASRRIIDRFGYLRGDMPRSVAAIDGAVGLAATYFTDRPYAFEDPRDEVKQFRTWALAAAKAGRMPAPLADLVAIEAGGMLLMDAAFTKPKRAKKVKHAPGMVLLNLTHDPDALLGDEPLAAMTGRYPTALVREEADVEVYKLSPVAAALVRRADERRDAKQLVARFGPDAMAAARSSLRDLRRLRILTP